MLKQLGVLPIAPRFVSSYAVSGVEPRVVGIGPEAIPSVLRKSGLKQSDIDLIELNEAFASQSLAVMRTLDLDPAKVNVNGGTIALGHPPGCSAKTRQVLNELSERRETTCMAWFMCVGTGQSAAGIFELLN